jgi:four helix bundle protein
VGLLICDCLDCRLHSAIGIRQLAIGIENCNRFEDLPVWQHAIELAIKIFALTARVNFKGYGGPRDQIERAAVSISNNIAEGFERGTTQETLTFLYISRGSSGEVRSMLCLLERLPGFEDLRSEISDLKSKAVSVSRQLRAWADSLQNSDIRGQRYLTNKTKRSTKEAREREEFLEELRKIREELQANSAGDGSS